MLIKILFFTIAEMFFFNIIVLASPFLKTHHVFGSTNGSITWSLSLTKCTAWVWVWMVGCLHVYLAMCCDFITVLQTSRLVFLTGPDSVCAVHMKMLVTSITWNVEKQWFCITDMHLINLMMTSEALQKNPDKYFWCLKKVQPLYQWLYAAKKCLWPVG